MMSGNFAGAVVGIIQEGFAKHMVQVGKQYMLGPDLVEVVKISDTQAFVEKIKGKSPYPIGHFLIVNKFSKLRPIVENHPTVIELGFNDQGDLIYVEQDKRIVIGAKEDVKQRAVLTHTLTRVL